MVPVGQILVVYTVCIRVHDIVDLERDHVNPAVRAVGKSEVEIEIVYYYLLSGKGVNYVYDGINATENNKMIMHWERCNAV